MIDEKIVRGELIRGSGKHQEKIEIIYEPDDKNEKNIHLIKPFNQYERN
jgi:hypothetical protein